MFSLTGTLLPFRMLRLALIIIALCAGTAASQSYKFDFGPGPAAEGWTRVTPETAWSSSRGYGFEPGADVSAELREGDDPIRSDFCTGEGEFMFSVQVPQGNYDVTVILGDAAGTSVTTVKAENRRLLFDRAATDSGQFISRTITVNRREVTSEDGSVTMSIKDRELTYYTWDDKLTLRFSGSRPRVCGVELEKTDTAVTVFLCGNSTVVDQLDYPWCSWGQMIPRFFSQGVSIANYAESGLTASGFLSMRRLEKIMSDARAGDYVFVEFGHNDQKNDNDYNNYADNLKTFRDRIMEKDAVPVFVSPTARRGDDDPETSIAGLAETMRNTARELGITLIDLNAMTMTVMKALGDNHEAAYQDVSHFTEFGGFELARCVAKAVKELDNSLTPFLNAEMPVFNPEEPDPVDYLTTPQAPYEPVGSARHPSRAAAGPAIHLSRNTVFYRNCAAGPIEFLVYSAGGTMIFRHMIHITGSDGSAAFPAFKRLTRGIYVIQLTINNHESAKALFYKI